jgi:hypothetical protein
MLRCIFKNISKYFQIVLLVSNFLLKWLQVLKSPYMHFSLIRLIPKFSDTYIMYSQEHFIFLKYLLFFFYNLKFKKLRSGYDY